MITLFERGEMDGVVSNVCGWKHSALALRDQRTFFLWGRGEGGRILIPTQTGPSAAPPPRYPY